MLKISLLVFLIFAFVFAGYSQSIGIGTGTALPDSSALLELRSSKKGFLPTRMTTAQRDSIVLPAQGLTIYNTSINCLEYFTGMQWFSVCGVPMYYRSCKQIKATNILAASGIYTIDPDSLGSNPPIKCYCDMTTDGGGWTLAVNYNHKGNTDPAKNVRSNSLPLLGSTSLGTDESATQFWGQASNSLLSQFSFTELRFYGITANHNRIINFKTSHAGTINYFKTGTGSCSGIQSSFTAMGGHSAFLPASSVDFLPNSGDSAVNRYPFFNACNYHWAIGGDNGGTTAHRWEVDDILCTGCCSVVQGFTKDTYHQIWFR